MLLPVMALLFAASANEMPKCDATRAGEYWPPSANQGPRELAAAARAGKLYRCERAIWRHRWERLSISVEDLRKERADKNRSAAKGANLYTANQCSASVSP